MICSLHFLDKKRESMYCLWTTSTSSWYMPPGIKWTYVPKYLNNYELFLQGLLAFWCDILDFLKLGATYILRLYGNKSEWNPIFLEELELERIIDTLHDRVRYHCNLFPSGQDCFYAIFPHVQSLIRFQWETGFKRTNRSTVKNHGCLLKWLKNI